MYCIIIFITKFNYSFNWRFSEIFCNFQYNLLLEYNLKAPHAQYISNNTVKTTAN